ncbi:MAG: PQQ-binding-like beta-propeller repeat protein [Saprospiraceae bacterium]|nr:PQQ-binding-like beta-propeller repeat protein [Pyrinomonadaceae bacterium]
MTRNYLKNLYVAKILIVLVFSFQPTSPGLFAQPVGEGVSKLQKCREYDFADTSVISVASDNENIYVATEEGSVHAIDPMASDKIWSSNIGGQIVSNLIVAKDRILITTSAVLTNGAKPDFSILRSLSIETGLTNWSISLPYSIQMFLGNSGNAIVSISREGAVAAHDASTGNILWKKSFQGNLTAPPKFGNDWIVFGTDKKDILVISSKNGETALRSDLKFAASAVSIPSEKTIAIGDERGNVNLIDVNSGKTIWKFKSGAKISFLSSAEEGLLAASNDNFVYLISDYNGDIIWKRRLPGRVAGPLLVAENIVVLQVYADKSAFLLDLESGRIVNQFIMDQENSPGIMPNSTKDNSIIFSTAASLVSYGVKPC